MALGFNSVAWGSAEVFQREAPFESAWGPCAPGFYWQACWPGCLPDGEPIGPFASADEALADAEGAGDV